MSALDSDLQFTGLFCPECRYDLRGLPQPVCPECGRRVDTRGELERQKRRQEVGLTIAVLTALYSLLGLYCVFTISLEIATPFYGWCGTGRVAIYDAWALFPFLMIPPLGAWLACHRYRSGVQVARTSALTLIGAWAAAWVVLELV